MENLNNDSNKNIKFSSSYILDLKKYKEFYTRIYFYKKICNYSFNISNYYFFVTFIY